MTDTSQWPAVPVYKPRDYLRILELSATGDLPATWEDWWELFKRPTLSSAAAARPQSG
ncbi:MULTISPECIES: hypothetical protein [unclassified Mesorhizobium]|uniref:hypothetical protein n=1 Tax=unclassified Mesorhizobium TaxID=325217 RepID=UPI00142F079C|nr:MULTISPECIES: hypothetical protein [unclassified Mesorhizobium]